jgi:hypothetical protein
MEEIRQILGKLDREEIQDNTAERRLAQLGGKALAEFIVDAKNRGWISNFNLGLDEDGKVL